VVKGVIVLLLSITLCAVILGAEYKFYFLPVSTMPDESRKMLYDLLIFIAGVISGYIGHVDK